MEASKAAASLRWKLVREALHQQPKAEAEAEAEAESEVVHRISRKSSCGGFNMIPSRHVDEGDDEDVCFCYTPPLASLPRQIYLLQRRPSSLHHLAADFDICNQHDIDNTGLVCPWPSEDVLAHFCLSNPHLFASKTVIELGAGYGLAGMLIAAVTDASHVVISDGNPQVVNYIQRSINLNNNNNSSSSSSFFGTTQVNSMLLHWNHHPPSPHLSNRFDVIVASDCTFFKDFHKALVRTLKLLMNKDPPSQAFFFSPKRGDSLDKFLRELQHNHLHFTLTENYDDHVFNRHQSFMMGADLSWPNYEKDHCYPLLVRITL